MPTEVIKSTKLSSRLSSALLCSVVRQVLVTGTVRADQDTGMAAWACKWSLYFHTRLLCPKFQIVSFGFSSNLRLKQLRQWKQACHGCDYLKDGLTGRLPNRKVTHRKTTSTEDDLIRRQPHRKTTSWKTDPLEVNLAGRHLTGGGPHRKTTSQEDKLANQSWFKLGPAQPQLVKLYFQKGFDGNLSTKMIQLKIHVFTSRKPSKGIFPISKL